MTLERKRKIIINFIILVAALLFFLVSESRGQRHEYSHLKVYNFYTGAVEISQPEYGYFEINQYSIDMYNSELGFVSFDLVVRYDNEWQNMVRDVKKSWIRILGNNIQFKVYTSITGDTVTFFLKTEGHGIWMWNSYERSELLQFTNSGNLYNR